jgi:hypothetical protein
MKAHSPTTARHRLGLFGRVRRRSDRRHTCGSRWDPLMCGGWRARACRRAARRSWHTAVARRCAVVSSVMLTWSGVTSFSPLASRVRHSRRWARMRAASWSRVGPLVSGGRPRSWYHARTAAAVSPAVRVVSPAARARVPGRLERMASLGSSIIIGRVSPAAASAAGSTLIRRESTPGGVISDSRVAVEANGPTAVGQAAVEHGDVVAVGYCPLDGVTVDERRPPDEQQPHATRFTAHVWEDRRAAVATTVWFRRLRQR